MVDARDSAIPWDYFYCNLSRILLDYLLTIRSSCCVFVVIIIVWFQRFFSFEKKEAHFKYTKRSLSFSFPRKIIIDDVSCSAKALKITTEPHPSIHLSYEEVLQPHPTMTEMLLMTVIIGMCTSYCSAYCVVVVVVAKYWIWWEHHTNITDYNHNQIWDRRQVISYAKPKPKWHLMRRALAVASVSMVLHIPSRSCHHHHHIQWYYLQYNNLINEVRKSQ